MSTPDAPKTSAPNWKSGRADGLSAARDAVAVVAHALHFPTLLSALLAEIVMAACAHKTFARQARYAWIVLAHAVAREHPNTPVPRLHGA